MGILQNWFGESKQVQELKTQLADVQRTLNLNTINEPKWAGDKSPVFQVSDPLSVPAIFAAVKSNCDALSTIPYTIWNKENEKQYDHPYYELLNRRPNSYQTPQQLWGKLYLDLQVKQEAYLWASREGTRVISLTNVEPSNVRLENGKYYIKDANGTFQDYLVIDGVKVPVDPYYLWHFVGFSKDGKKGTSQYDLCKNTVEFAQALETSGLAFHKNGCRNTGFFTLPEGTSPEDELKYMKDFRKANQGPKKAGGVAALPHGMGWLANSTSPQDAQYADISVHQMRQGARLTLNPPFTYADYERQTWANMVEARLDWVQRNLRPLVVIVEQRLNLSLWTTSEAKSYRVEMILDALERGSFAVQVATLVQAVGGPVMNRPEARKILTLKEEEETEITTEETTETTTETVTPVATEPAEGETVQDQSMNGAQTASLLEIADKVVQKQLPPEAAKLIIQSAFPALAKATIDAIVDSLTKFEPEPIAPAFPPQGTDLKETPNDSQPKEEDETSN